MMSKQERLVSVGSAYPEITLTAFPWTERQQSFIDLSLDPKTKVIFCSAPAGTGKTLLSLYCSLRLAIDDKNKKILYVRNPVESCSGKGIGFIKGKTDEKMQPYIMPLYDNLYKIADKHSVNMIEKRGMLSSEVLGFTKGRTYDDTYMIVDEAEDFTLQDLRLIISRMGKRAKLFIIGDVKQSNVRNSNFGLTYDLFNTPEDRGKGIHCFKFTAKDIMRNDIIQHMITKIDSIVV